MIESDESVIPIPCFCLAPHRVATLSTAASVALAMAILLLVLHVRDDIERGIVQQAGGIHLIVGNDDEQTLVKAEI